MRQGLNYLRVSSRRQVDKGFDEDGLSLPAQREACRRYANEHAITIVGEYLERGESARTADRPAFQAMLARIQQQRDVQVVVVHKVDRFARNLEDHVTVRALLRRLGVELTGSGLVEALGWQPSRRGARSGDSGSRPGVAWQPQTCPRGRSTCLSSRTAVAVPPDPTVLSLRDAHE